MATPNLTAITTVTPGILAAATMNNGANTLYTVAASKAAKLSSLSLTNITATSVTVSVSVTKSGGGAHAVVSSYVLTANDTTVIVEIAGMWLGDGDVIGVTVTAAASVDAVLSGLEFT